MSPSIENGRCGDRAVVEHRVHVPHQQHVGPAASARVPITRSPSCGSPALGLVGPAFDLPAAVAESRLAQVGDDVDALAASRNRSRRSPSVRGRRRTRRTRAAARSRRALDVHAADASMATSAATGGRDGTNGVGAVVDRAGAPIRVEPIAIDDPGPGEVLVRLAASGVCHSDVWAIEHGNWGAAMADAARARGRRHRRARSAQGVTTVAPRRPRGAVVGHPLRPVPPVPARRAPPMRTRTAPTAAHAPDDRRRPHRGAVAAARSPPIRSSRSRRSMPMPDDDPAVPRVPARMRGLDRGRRGAPDRERCGPAPRVAVIGLGGIGLAALQGAEDRRRDAVDRGGRRAGEAGVGCPVRCHRRRRCARPPTRSRRSVRLTRRRGRRHRVRGGRPAGVRGPGGRDAGLCGHGRRDRRAARSRAKSPSTGTAPTARRMRNKATCSSPTAATPSRREDFPQMARWAPGRLPGPRRDGDARARAHRDDLAEAVPRHARGRGHPLGGGHPGRSRTRPRLSR